MNTLKALWLRITLEKTLHIKEKRARLQSARTTTRHSTSFVLPIMISLEYINGRKHNDALCKIQACIISMQLLRRRLR